jgi:peptide/nickel transport system substrate-binding protein
MARQNEPGALASKFGGSRSGLEEYARLFGASLVRQDYTRTTVPMLAEDVPSIEAGTMRIQPDGRVETTYKLRPAAVWHDGAPFTADDVIFTWQAIMNPELAALDRRPERSIARMEALDPHTVVISWSEPTIYANAYELEPLPRHILEPLLQRGPQAFANAAYWSTEWVGLGPYQLADWVPGSYVKGRAFADYVLGKPKIDEIFVHFIVDANQVVARMLAGSIDLTLGSSIRVGEGYPLKQQLEAHGEGTVVPAHNSVRVADIQFREPQPPPARDVRVRRALLHALNKPLLVETLHYGIYQPADIWLSPEHRDFKAVDQAIRKYPYDVNRAQQLLAEAGWSRTGDALLRDAAGETFDFQVRVTEGVQPVRDAQVILEFWKAVGINAELDVLPRARQNEQEYRAKFPGTDLGSPGIDPESMTRWLGEETPSDATRWRGSNRGAYLRPEIDRLIADYFTTLDASRRSSILVEVARANSEDLPSPPLYYQLDVYGIRAGLQGVIPTKPGDGWTVFNAHQWYWDR